jgi:hypothetical protein
VNRSVYLVVDNDEKFLGSVEEILNYENQEEVSHEIFHCVRDILSELVYNPDYDGDSITIKIELR